MNVHVDGYRSTDENWTYAHSVPLEQVPISDQQRQVATSLGVSVEDYARNLFAGDLTRGQLKDRASLVGELVNQWLRLHQPGSEVSFVWLKTLEGKFRVDVVRADRTRSMFLDEEMMDSILDSANPDSETRFERVLRLNLGSFEETLAS